MKSPHPFAKLSVPRPKKTAAATAPARAALRVCTLDRRVALSAEGRSGETTKPKVKYDAMSWRSDVPVGRLSDSR